MEKIRVKEKSNLPKVVTDQLKPSYSYAEYRELVAELAATNSTTGEKKTESLINYTQLNHARMKRLDKTVKIPEQVQSQFEEYSGRQTWYVLTESWCGDAAQSMPAMNKLAELAPHIELKVLLRDENLELMDQFLTEGSRSIPKLIVVDDDSGETIAEWGPRPSVATQLANAYKAEHGSLSPEFKKDLQVWYTRDKSQNIIEDLTGLLTAVQETDTV